MNAKQRDALLKTLRDRFEAHANRHPGLSWSHVEARLKSSAKLTVLEAMEKTGGEPDVIGHDAATGALVFVDCAAESPAGRRSICYDPEALEARKENRPAHSAVGLAAELGVELLTEAQYRDLQKLGAFDTKTSSWVATPRAIRALGGALFCDRRYETVFVYHNGAQSYYAARGFRGRVQI